MQSQIARSQHWKDAGKWGRIRTEYIGEAITQLKTFLRDVVGTIVGAVIIFLILQATLQSSIVVGSSMEPSFEDGQRLLVNKVVYYFHEPERGDVIVFHPPYNKQAEYIKRVIGLPGESIEIKEGKVYIYQNGEVFSLDEQSYIDEPPRYTLPRTEISVDNYFVLGDNRDNSNDSHNNWTVNSEDITGKAWLSIWPPAEWGLVPDVSPHE